jgi:type I restriction enzyme S subunit
MGRSLTEASLAEVCSLVTDGTHDTPKRVPSGFPLIKAKEIVSGQIDFSSCDQISEAEHRKVIARSKPEFGDTLFTHIGASLGAAAFVNTTREFSIKNIALFKPNPAIIDSRYLYYLVVSPDFQSLAIGTKTGSAQPFLGLSQLRGHRIQYDCDLRVQQRIAGILSAYDELIENSQRRIKILESMARALYREWFVHFRFPGHENHPRVASPLGEIPQGWSVKKLGVIAENFDRMRKPLSKMQRAQLQGEYPYYGAAKVFDYVNDYIFDGEYLLLAEDGSVITPERAPVLQLVKEKFWPNNHTHILRGKPPFSTHFLYLGLSEVDISPYITGAAQPKITQENMNRIPFFCGPEDLHLEFNRLVEPMIRQSHILQRQVKNLRRTRDLLLPRLLSGQIEIEAA